jgi:hypothetical protein
MLLLFIERWRFIDIMHRAIDTHAHETIALDRLENLAVLPFSSANERGQHLNARVGRIFHDSVGDLLDRLLGDRLTALVAMRDSNTRVEQAKIIINLGHGADRGTRVARR